MPKLNYEVSYGEEKLDTSHDAVSLVNNITVSDEPFVRTRGTKIRQIQNECLSYYHDYFSTCMHAHNSYPASPFKNAP